MRAHLEFNAGLTIIQLWEVVCGMVAGETDLSVYSTQLNIANCTIDATVPSPYVAYPSGDQNDPGNFARKCYALPTPTAEGYYRHIYPTWADSTKAYIYFAVNMHSTLGLVRDKTSHYAGSTDSYVISEFGSSDTSTNPNAFYLDFIIDANGDILITGDFTSTTTPSLGSGYILLLCEHNKETSVLTDALDKGCFMFDSYILAKTLGETDSSCLCVTESRAYKFGSRGSVSSNSRNIDGGTANLGLILEDRFLTVDKAIGMDSGVNIIDNYVRGYGHGLFPSWLKFTHGDASIEQGDTVLIGTDIYDVHDLYEYSQSPVHGYFLVKQGVY